MGKRQKTRKDPCAWREGDFEVGKTTEEAEVGNAGVERIHWGQEGLRCRLSRCLGVIIQNKMCLKTLHKPYFVS